jgi:fructose-1,6-bisphosphatase/inositol monophosphatase family enzyme
MHLTQEQLGELLLLAKEAALAAGQIIALHQGQVVSSELKGTGTSLASKIVTEVDSKAEQAILKILHPTLTQYDLGLLTEESTDDQSRFHKDYFWCIDPLDGTLPFTRNEAGYACSIALVTQDGKSILGVVHDPRHDNLYWAVKNSGAFKNGAPFIATESVKDITIDNGPGGAVMQALATIESAPAVFFKKPKTEQGGGCLWDYAATSIIHSEAGGTNRDFQFQPLNLNSSESVFMNRCGVIFSAAVSDDVLKKVITKIP